VVEKTDASTIQQVYGDLSMLAGALDQVANYMARINKHVVSAGRAALFDDALIAATKQQRARVATIADKLDAAMPSVRDLDL